MAGGFVGVEVAGAADGFGGEEVGEEGGVLGGDGEEAVVLVVAVAVEVAADEAQGWLAVAVVHDGVGLDGSLAGG